MVFADWLISRKSSMVLGIALIFTYSSSWWCFSTKDIKSVFPPHRVLHFTERFEEARRLKKKHKM